MTSTLTPNMRGALQWIWAGSYGTRGLYEIKGAVNVRTLGALMRRELIRLTGATGGMYYELTDAGRELVNSPQPEVISISDAAMNAAEQALEAFVAAPSTDTAVEVAQAAFIPVTAETLTIEQASEVLEIEGACDLGLEWLFTWSVTAKPIQAMRGAPVEYFGWLLHTAGLTLISMDFWMKNEKIRDESFTLDMTDTEWEEAERKLQNEFCDFIGPQVLAWLAQRYNEIAGRRAGALP